MQLTTLTAISPVDGRYRKTTERLSGYFSEAALIKYRVVVEVQYLLFLAEKRVIRLPAKAVAALHQLEETFSITEAQRVKELEKTTAHDVKAVEYLIKEHLLRAGVPEKDTEWVHFGLTSQDVNNTAIPLLWKEAIELEYLPAVLNLNTEIKLLAQQWKGIPLLARTHGQPASPTTLGKELMVFVERIQNAVELLLHIPFTAKFGGATGNFNAHHAAFPKHDWPKLADAFVKDKLGLERCRFTTQIEHYDNLAAQCDAIKRINNILIDFCRDVWTYISVEYFGQKTKAGEVGSSAMPHKVNPIDFENAEGNLGVANALLEHLSSKLPISRLQRDLTDSTVLRNLGVPFAHTVLAVSSIEKGLGKLVLNENKLWDDLEANWAVVSEAIQTVLRREGYPKPYEALKKLTRGKQKITKATIHKFIDGLDVSAAAKKELKRFSPHNYVGMHPDF